MEIFDFLSTIFLFSGLDKCELDEIVRRISLDCRKFLRGDVIYSPTFYEKKVGFVVSGKCEVRHIKPDGNSVVLNTLEVGDSFGILAIFSDEEDFPTQIYASRTSEIVFFEQKDILRLVNEYPAVSMNVINFLVNRIRYLNSKIATFSGTRVEDKLASFILCEYEKYNTSSIPFNCKKSAEAINSGRASVYRALADLEKCGYISVADKKINILDLEGLERFSK